MRETKENTLTAELREKTTQRQEIERVKIKEKNFKAKKKKKKRMKKGTKIIIFLLIVFMALLGTIAYLVMTGKVFETMP